MGRNADKRRAQQRGALSSEATNPADLEVDRHENPEGTMRVNTRARAEIDPPPAWWAQSLMPPPVEVPEDDDGTLARALFQVTSLLGTALSRPETSLVVHMQKIADAVARIIDADTVSLLRLEPGDGDLVPARLVLTASHGLTSVDVGAVSFDLGDGIAGRVALTGECVQIEDAPRDARFSHRYGQRTEIGSLIAVPLRAGKKMLGVMTASRREIRAFSPVDEDRLLLTATAIAQDLEQSRLYREAVGCPLTGLASRVALLHALPREVEIARRYQAQLSLVIFDVDGLAELNQKHGRDAGDRFLVQSAARLAHTVRAADLVARLGGDEMCVLLPMTPPNQARATAKRLMKALTTPPLTPSRTWSAAVGTLQTHVEEDAAGLLFRVDRALIEAKAQGGATISASIVDPRS